MEYTNEYTILFKYTYAFLTQIPIIVVLLILNYNSKNAVCENTQEKLVYQIIGDAGNKGQLIESI